MFRALYPSITRLPLRWLLFGIFTVGVLISPVSAELIVQGTPLWGFDGKARIGKFNLISIEVANDSDQPWEGSFEFQAVQGFGGVDIPTIQPGMFIEGYGRRQLQFVVFIPQITEFQLKWGRRAEQRFKIDEPKIVESPAVTQLVSDSDFGPRMEGVGSFEETSFPNSAAGLDALGTVLLDHIPRWNEAQKQAFMDWLHAGGEVHLYHETAGSFPEFSQLLAELNVPLDETMVGSGRLIKHATTLQQSQQKFPRLKETNQKYPEWQLSSNLFSILKEMTQPDHNWPLIYCLAILYLLLLFPGCWLIGRKRGDYRVTYGAILGIVVLFSMGFHTVGSRGYGEKTSVNSVAIARLAGNGRMIVTQWSSLFITSGGVYEIKHLEEGLVYSTGQTEESVLGVALNRPIGLMKTDIPSFSARTILHTGVLKSTPLAPQVKALKVNNRSLQELKIGVPEGQAWPSISQAYAVYQNTICACNVQNGILVKTNSNQTLTNLLQQDQWNVYQYYWNQTDYTVDQLFDRSMMPLIAQDLGLKSDAQRDEYSLPKGKIRVYLFAEMPEEFFAQKDVSPQQAGRVMYTFDVPAENIEEQEVLDSKD